jgi:hypothetical protein
MKCTKGIPDKCSRCKEETMGDYYQRGEKILCRECHKKQQTKIPTYKRDMMRGYDKVRDCTGVHQHKFPGKDPKIIVRHCRSLSGICTCMCMGGTEVWEVVRQVQSSYR